MAQVVLQEILEQLGALNIDELQELDQAIQDYLAAKTQTADQTTFEQALMASGLVKQIKQPTFRQVDEQQLIQVQGKPLSETIAEERR